MADEQVLETQLFQGNCLDILPQLKDHSVDLIVTSPPYADQRKDTYDSNEKGTIFFERGDRE